jgi:hypothetical protein
MTGRPFSSVTRPRRVSRVSAAPATTAHPTSRGSASVKNHAWRGHLRHRLFSLEAHASLLRSLFTAALHRAGNDFNFFITNFKYYFRSNRFANSPAPQHIILIFIKIKVSLYGVRRLVYPGPVAFTAATAPTTGRLIARFDGFTVSVNPSKAGASSRTSNVGRRADNFHSLKTSSPCARRGTSHPTTAD